MSAPTGSIASSIVGIRPRFYDPYSIQSRDDTPGLADIVTRIATSDRITEEDIMRNMVYVIDWKIVRNVSSDLLGMLMSQSFTNENSDSLNTFEFKYLVDRTGPARETGWNTGAPVVTLDMVTRRVRLTNPRSVCISVPKPIYRRMANAMKEISGLNDRERSIKPYLGEDGSLRMTPKWKAEVRNYMDALKTRTDVALNSQNQGTNESQLEFLFSRAPDLKLVPSKDAVIAHDDIRLVVPNMLRSFLENTFFINKIMGAHLKKPTLSHAMSRLYRGFLLNTSENLMPELEPTFENTPFKRATGIITCTSNVRDALASMGLVTHAPDAVMVKKISYCRVGVEDLHPFDSHAPHNMVQQVDVGMFRQTETGSLRTFEKRVEAPIEYLSSPEGYFVLNVATEANFGNKNSLSKIGMRQIFRYDEMVPVGFIVGCNGHGDFDKAVLKPAPQRTYYTDHHGITRCLDISGAAGLITKLQNQFSAFNGESMLTIDDIEAPFWGKGIPLLFGFVDGNGKYEHYKYSICNPYMVDEIFLSNVLAYIRANADGPVDRLKNCGDLLKVRSERIMKILVENYKISPEAAHNAIDAVRSIKNEDIGAHMIKWGFNPGVALVYVREVTNESDAIMVSRPGGAHLITAPHELEKHGDMSDMSAVINFNMKQRHGHSICGLGNTSVKLCGAFNVQRIGAECTDVVDPLDDDFAKEFEYSPQTRDHCGNLLPDKEPKWWPVLWDPRVQPGFFDGACSPMGRSPVPFDSERDFTDNFWNTNRPDVQFSNTFSINSLLHEYGPNAFGYPKKLLNNPRCPLRKYLTFSPERRIDVSEAQVHQLRLGQMHGGGLAADGSEIDMSMPTYSCARNLSVTCGAAVVKRCYTHEGLLNEEDQHRFPSIYPGAHVIKNERKYGHNYFYPGSGAFEIFDIGVAHSAVL